MPLGLAHLPALLTWPGSGKATLASVSEEREATDPFPRDPPPPAEIWMSRILFCEQGD